MGGRLGERTSGVPATAAGGLVRFPATAASASTISSQAVGSCLQLETFIH
jgi:hypothetical protein